MQIEIDTTIEIDMESVFFIIGTGWYCVCVCV